MRAITRSTPVVALGFVVALALGVSPSSAQQWPQRTVRLLLPIGPGTAPDFAARLFAERLAPRWGQPVIVENRQGADGLVALSAFVGARDSHTLFFSYAAPITINPLFHDKLPYDPARDLVPIGSTSALFLAVAVPASLKIGTMTELVGLARSQPGKLNWVGAPGLPEIFFGGFNKSADLNMVRVSYREMSQAVVDLSEARFHAMSTSLTNILPQVHAGKIRVLAVTNRDRSPVLPDVPTAMEAGYPELTAEGLLGFFGGRDMPADLRDRIAADIRTVAADPAIAPRLTAAGQILRSFTPAEYAAAIEDQRARVAAIVHATGMKMSQ